MRIPILEAQEQLDNLIQQAAAGEEIILTREGRDAVLLVPVSTPVAPASRRALIAAVRASAAGKASPGPDAARSQDFLYDDE